MRETSRVVADQGHVAVAVAVAVNAHDYDHANVDDHASSGSTGA
jgi:hypothetical protein